MRKRSRKHKKAEEGGGTNDIYRNLMMMIVTTRLSQPTSKQHRPSTPHPTPPEKGGLARSLEGPRRTPSGSTGYLDT